MSNTNHFVKSDGITGPSRPPSCPAMPSNDSGQPSLHRNEYSSYQDTNATNMNGPRIWYFISRPNGACVPLIPADELPHNVQLVDVPRCMNLTQTRGMIHVDSQPYTGITFQLAHEVSPAMGRSPTANAAMHSRASSSTSTRFQGPDALARQALANSLTASHHGHSLPQRPTSVPQATPSFRQPATSSYTSNDPQDVIDAILHSQSGAEAATRSGYQSKNRHGPTPSGIIPDQDKKEFCTYWIRTGDCDYMQQGCMFKHEMPDTLEKLRKLGFSRWPGWWQEKTQQIRLNPIKKEDCAAAPSEVKKLWLKRRDSDSDSECETSDQDTPSGKKILALPAPYSGKGKAPCTPGGSVSEATAPSKSCQQSTIEDLISFGTQPDDTPSSTASSDTSPTVAMATPTSTPATTPNTTPDLTQKVFVPAGESAEVHIMEARKRDSQARRSQSAKMMMAQPLEQQIQILQRKNNDTGLMGSKHAPKQAAPAGPSNATARHKARPRVPKQRGAGAGEKGGEGKAET